MEGRGTHAHQARRKQDRREAADKRQHQNANQGADHAGGQQPRFGMTVGVVADPRLQQGGGQLEGQGDQADLGKAQAVVGLEHRVDRRQHGLDQVIDQVRQGAGAENAHDQGAGLGRSGGSSG